MKIHALLIIALLVLTACGGGSSSNLNKTSSAVAISSASSLMASSSKSSLSSVLSSSASSTILQISSTTVSLSSVTSLITSSSSAISFSSPSGVADSKGNVAILDGVGSTTLLVIAQPTYSPVVGETLILDWFAYSAIAKIISVNWTRKSGPAVSITSDVGVLKLNASAVGDLVIEGTVTDSNGTTYTSTVQYSVQAPESSKAKLLQGRSDGVGVDLVIVGDGFTAAQQQSLRGVGQNFMQQFFDADKIGIASHRSLWNIWVVDSISASSVIGSGKTLFNSFFNCQNIARLLCVANDSEVISYVAESVPQFDPILVAVNSTTYGGAGGRVATFSLSDSAHQVATHELGHSFAGLADEYSTSDGQGLPDENQNINITVNTNPRTVKWRHWIDNINSIAGFDRNQNKPMETGYFLGGAYHESGVWRPTLNSLMRELGQPLGSVNSEEWALTAWRYAENINTAKHFRIPGDSVINVFHLPTIAGSNLQEIVWTVNGVTIESAKNKNFLVAFGTAHSADVVVVSVKDNTGLIRYNPEKIAEYTHTLHAQ